MAIAFVQSQTAGSGTSAGVTTITSGVFASSTTTGNTIIVCIGEVHITPVVTSVTDTAGNTYAKATTVSNVTAVETGEIWYATNITGGSSFTVSANTSLSVAIEFVVQEFSGLATTSVLDQVASATGNSTAPNSGSTTTTTNANELVVGLGLNSSAVSLTVGAGFSNFVQKFSNPAGFSNVGMESKIVSSMGTQSANFTMATGQWACAVATFAASGGVVATPSSPTNLLMGI